MSPVDAFRVGAIVANVTVLVLSAAVVALYTKRWWVDTGVRGLLLWLVVTSYFVYVVAAVFEIRDHLGEPLTWRAPVYMTSALVGVTALATFVRYELQERHGVDT